MLNKSIHLFIYTLKENRTEPHQCHLPTETAVIKHRVIIIIITPPVWTPVTKLSEWLFWWQLCLMLSFTVVNVFWQIFVIKAQLQQQTDHITMQSFLFVFMYPVNMSHRSRWSDPRSQSSTRVIQSLFFYIELLLLKL